MAEAQAEEKTTEVQTSKTIVLTGHGGVDKLKIQQKPKPKPEKGEILIKVKATGITFSDLMTRQGMNDKSPKPPCVLGYEASGIVEELGEEVDSFKVGDRVCVLSTSGCWAEFIAVPVGSVFPIPDDMSFEDAAALPVNYLTAYFILYDFGNLRKGKSVLVHMAAGGVGIAVTQLCKQVADVTVFGTCSASKHDIVKEEGVTHPIDYRTQDYVAEVKKISPQGVDIVLDPLGGADASKGFQLLKPMGKIIHYGAANIVGPGRSLLKAAKVWWDTKNINPLGLMIQNKAVCGFHLGYLDKDPEVVRTAFNEILDLYKEGKIKPRVDSVWAYEDVGKAMSKIHMRENVGKVLLSVDKEPLPETEEEKEKKEKKEKKKKEDKKSKKEKNDDKKKEEEEKKEEKDEKEEKKEDKDEKEDKKEEKEEEEKEGDAEEPKEEQKEEAKPEEDKPEEKADDTKTEE